MTKYQALNTLDAILTCNGYKETAGDNWLGPRLMALRDYIVALPDGEDEELPSCYQTLPR